MQGLSVVIITFNEEKNIGRCIASVSGIADEIIVVDSFSDDNTVVIAREMGAIVKQSAFDGYIEQKNKAISLAKHRYVLLLDADEAPDAELAAAILETKNDFLFAAYAMKRCNVYCGKQIKHGLWYPDKKIRLFDKLQGRCGGLNPHDKIVLNNKTKIKMLQGNIMHYTFNSASEYQSRNETLSSIAAHSLYINGIKKNSLKIFFSPLWAFINGYFLRLGFLDGYDGLIIAALCAQQSFLKYHKLRQLQKQLLHGIICE
ncbi:MAG: glycosyltransferase family 2 protein [Bacteroidetes bacterium]|nr:glycosyltransferase family 2 protein [Bacteroidota bacterium]